MLWRKSLVQIITIIGLGLPIAPISAAIVDSISPLPPSQYQPQTNNIFLAQAKQKRVALVIGNANYRQQGQLANPVNDATDMAKALGELGFDVIKVVDGDKKSMDEALDKFTAKLSKGSVGLFYYAGHGIQVNGENYAIPIDAKLNVEKDVDYEALPIGKVQNAMEGAQTDINIIILDACRNNPFSRKWSRNVQSQGLAPINASVGSFIAFATAPGSYAADGTGRNGTFTSYLLKYIKEPNLSIDEVFKKVRQGVYGETEKTQVPWSSTSLIGDFSFNSEGGSTVAVNTPKPTPTPTSTPPELQNIEDSIFYKDQGLSHLREKKYDLALADFTKAIDIDPRDANAYYNRALVYDNLGDFNKSIADYTKTIELDPNATDAYNNRGLAYSYLGQYDRAISDYSSAIAIDSNYILAYYNRGLAYYDLQDYDRAVADYDRAIQIDPNYAAAYNNRGLVYYYLNNMNKALEDYSAAIRINPEYALAYSNRGLVYSAMNDRQKAFDDYSAAIRFDPSYASAYYNRGNVYLDSKDYQNAIKDFNESIKNDPKYVAAYNNRGLAYYYLKQYPQALADYDKAIQLNRDYGLAYYNRALVFYDLKKYEQSISDNSQVIRLNPQDADALFNRGLCYEILGQKDKALKDYQEAAKWYQQQGRDELYRDTLQRIQNLR